LADLEGEQYDARAKRRAMNACLMDPRPLLRFDFGPYHPFKIYRLGLTYELMSAYGLIGADGVRVLAPREASEEEAMVFHSQGYLETLRLASTGMWVPSLFSHGLGTSDNPVFPDVYDWAMSIAGGSIDCASELISGRAKRAFNIAGGLHHAMPSRAAGFCHVNDAVLAIHTLLRAGNRVAYVDIDAHHGDGVQHAFYSRSDVLTISLHQTGYTIFPGTGFVEEVGEAEGRGYSVNVPLLPGAGDEAYERAFEQVVLPLLEAFRADVLVTQLGADGLVGDVVANLRMSLRQFERCVELFRSLGRPWLGLGGGGYDVGNVVRAWTLAWGVMLEAPLPDEIPASWMTRASSYGITVSNLRDAKGGSPTSERVMKGLDEVIDQLRDEVFPLVRSREPSNR
jgi:acetoin utilization protein AcuC